MGIYDRDYYREDGRWSNPLARSQGTLFLAVLYVAMFVAQVGTEVRGPAPDRGLTAALELDVNQVLHGQVWRLVTYSLVHQPGNPFHLVFTVGFLIWIGHQVEDIYGTREYLAFYLLTTLIGGVGYFLVSWVTDTRAELLGPSGAVTSVLFLFALHYPGWRIFFFPIWLVIALYALGDVVTLANGSNPARVAVHLFGAAFAFAYHTYTLRVLNWLPFGGRSGKAARRVPGPKLRTRPPAPEPEPAAAAAAVSGAGKAAAAAAAVDEHLEAKLDQVLEKVARHGKESLTDGEREILLRASEIYKNRRKPG